jgi:tetratricopeptide (TPR) repeat protein
MKLLKMATIIPFVFLTAWSVEIELEVDLSDNNPLTAAIFRGADEAFKLNSDGLDALESNELKLAEALFEKAIDVLPFYSDAQNNLGVVYYRRGEVSRAKELWNSISVSDKKYHLSWFNLGILSFDHEKYQEAEELFKKTIKLKKRFAQGELMLGRTALALGDVPKALGRVDLAYKINPKNSQIWSNYAFLLLESGDTTKAISILDKHRSNSEALQLLGQISAVRGDSREAISLLESALKKGDDRSFVPVLLQLYLEGEKWKKAVSLFEKQSSSGEKTTAELWNSGALAYQGAGKTVEALNTLSRGVARFPKDGDLRYNYVQLLHKMGKYEVALKELQKMDATLKDGHAFFTEASIYKKLGDNINAKKSISQALVLDQRAEYYQFMGLTLVALGEFDSGKMELKKALALNPSLRHAKISLAILEHSGDISALVQDAKKEFESCNNSCDSSLLRLVYLTHLDGKSEEAVTFLKKRVETKNEEYYLALTTILQESGRWMMAFNVITDSTAIATFSRRGELLLAGYLSEGGRFSEGERVALKLLEEASPKEQERLLYLVGYNRMKMKNYRSAIEPLEELYKLNPRNRAASGVLAFIYKKTGDDKKAEQLWKSLVTVDGSNVSVLVNLSLLALEKESYSEALNYIKDAIELKGSSVELHINLGNILFDMKEYEKAYDSYLLAKNSEKSASALVGAYWSAKELEDSSNVEKIFLLLKDEDGDDTRRAVADYLFSLKKYQNSINELDMVAEKDWIDWKSIGVAAVALKNSTLAEIALDSARVLGGSEKKLRALQRDVSFLRGDYDKILEGGIESGEDGSYNRVVLLFKAEKYEDAVVAVNRLLFSFEGESKKELLKIAGNSSIELKKWDDVVRYFSLLAEEFPAGDWYLNMAIGFYNLNDIERSHQNYLKARVLDSSIKNANIEQRYEEFLNSKKSTPTKVTVKSLDEVDSLYNEALRFHQEGKTDLAERLYQQVLKIDDKHYRTWNNLGALYGALGEIDKAIESYENAVSRRADIVDGYLNLVNVYLAIDDLNNAKKWCEKGLKKDSGNSQLQGFMKEIETLMSLEK